MAELDDDERTTDETRQFLEAMIALGIEQRAQTDAAYLALKRDTPGRVDAYRKERHQLEANILAKWQAAQLPLAQVGVGPAKSHAHDRSPIASPTRTGSCAESDATKNLARAGSLCGNRPVLSCIGHVSIQRGGVTEAGSG